MRCLGSFICCALFLFTDSAVAQASDVDCAKCVDTSDLAPKAVTGGKIANKAVVTGHLADGAVTTRKLAPRGVTTQKLEKGAVTTSKIGDGSVTLDKLEPNLAADIMAAGAGWPVYSNGNTVGRLLTFRGVDSGKLILLSDSGYIFDSSIWGVEHLVKNEVFFSGTGCAGTAYANEFAAAYWTGVGESGVVVRAYAPPPGASGVYYVPRGSGYIAEQSYASRLNSNGLCSDTASVLSPAYELLQNDEAVTGVPDAKPAFPYSIGLP